MRSYVYVGIGSGLGGLARYATVALSLVLFGPTFPVGTILVNVAGSGLIGILAALASVEGHRIQRSEARLFLGVGFCGGFTTYSFFGWNSLLLGLGSAQLGLLYVTLTTFASLLAVWLTYTGTNRLTSS